MSETKVPVCPSRDCTHPDCVAGREINAGIDAKAGNRRDLNNIPVEDWTDAELCRVVGSEMGYVADEIERRLARVTP